VSDLESRVRAVLHDERYAVPGPPDPTTRVAAAIRRRQRNRMLVVGVAVLAVAVAVPLVLGPRRTPDRPTGTGSSPGAVPWLDAPTPLPSVAWSSPRSATSPCVAVDLSPATVQWAPGTANGHRVLIVSVRNTGLLPCTLADPARVHGADLTTGEPVTLVGQSTTYVDPPDDPTNERPPTLLPGDRAFANVVTDTGCDGGINPHTYRLDDITVVDRRDSLGAATAASVCPIVVGPWSRPLGADALAARGDAWPIGPLSAVVTVPGTVARGGELVYRVTLRNRTGDAVDLTPCPHYTERITRASATYRLNCAVHVIPAGGSVTYEMRMRVPPDLPAGDCVLFWQLGWPNGTVVAGATGNAPITVT